MKRRFSFNWFKKEVKRLDPQLGEEEDTFKVGMVLLIALQEGANIQRLVKFTGYDKEFVRKRVNQARKNGIFVGGSVHCDWFNEGHGAVAFWMDVLATQGLLVRRA